LTKRERVIIETTFGNKVLPSQGTWKEISFCLEFYLAPIKIITFESLADFSLIIKWIQ